MNKPLANKVALVTGAGKGIGLAIAKMLVKEGASLMLNARTKADLEKAREEILHEINPHAQVVLFPGSVADHVVVNHMIQETLDHFGRLDILVNNAGISPSFKLFQELTIQELDDTVDTNLKGPLYTMKYALPHMVHNGGGWIININSIAGKVAFAYSSVYCATKFGLKALTETVAEEQRQNNVKIIGIYPGEVNTPIWETIESNVIQDPRKMLVPEDIAEAVRYALLQSPKALVKDITVVPMHPPAGEMA